MSRESKIKEKKMQDCGNDFCRKWIARNIVWLLLVCVLIIFRTPVINWAINHIVPITALVEPDKWYLVAAIVLGIGVCYIASYKRLETQTESWMPRNERLFFLLIIYLIFRFRLEFRFYGIGDSAIGYSDYAWVTVILIEFCLYFQRRKRRKEHESKMQDKSAEPFFIDAPTAEDEMAREQYAIQLVSKMQAGINGEGAFTILLNEHFGAGKTSFMLQIEKKAKEKGVDVCWFKPWLYDSPQTLIDNYMRVLLEVLGDNDAPLRKMLDRYAKVLSPLDRYKVLSYITYDDVSVEKQLSEIKEKLKGKHHPIIMMIDDIDRLQSDELLRLLQLVRNIADFPYVYYIIAGDKEALQNRLIEKKIQEPDEYLKKFFNFEVCFPADDNQLKKYLEKGIGEVMTRYNLGAKGLLFFIQNLRYVTAIFANIRDVKRYLNILDYTLANFKAHELLDDVYIRDVAGVCMIQCIDSEFYKVLRDHNEYILKYNRMNFELKEEFSEIFMNREDKQLIEDMTESSSPTPSKSSRKQIKKDIVESVKSISDLVRWSKPTKMEIMGELLNILFPKNTAAPSKTCVCHPTEYFKYFSTTYKGSEMSNAEIIGIMRARDANFKTMVRNIKKDGRIEAFRHKMVWYLQTQNYSRMGALEMILDAFDIEWEEDIRNVGDKRKNEIFKIRYGMCLLSAFMLRKFVKKDSAHKDWDTIASWLIHSKQYERRIRVLYMLESNIPNHSAYIFETEDAVRQCILKSEKQYVDNIWTKAKYKPEVYRYIQQYMEVNYMISEYVAERVKAMKHREPFFYHLTKPTSDGLQWNNDFIESVIGNHRVFDYTDTTWAILVPEKWKKEFVRFDMTHKLTNDMINKSYFLKSAVKYWRNQQTKLSKV